MIQTEEERKDELRMSVDQLRKAFIIIDDAREKYLGEHQARNYGAPVARLLNWLNASLEAVIMLIEDEINGGEHQ